MAKKSGAGRTTERKGRPRPTGDNADLLDLFAEAKAKASERNGLKITLGGKEFTLWPSRIDYRQRQQLAMHTGMTPTDAAMMLGTGQGSIEAIAAVVAMAMFQMYEGVMPDMDGVLAWVEHELLERERPADFERMTVEVLDFDDHLEDESAPN